MKKKILLLGLIAVFCLSLSGGVVGEEAYVPGPEEDYNPGADKILVDKANNTITFVYDETDTELMKQYNALPTFADVPADAWYQLYVSHLSQLGIVSGRTESSFMPQEAVTRAEFAKMLTLAAEADLSSCSGVTDFADVEPDAWYAAPMEWASASGIIEGKTPTAFFPNDNITREEAGVMLYRLAVLQDSRVLQESEDLLKNRIFTDEASISDWALEPVERLKESAILLGDNYRNFKPQDAISRCEVAKMLSAYIVFSTKPTYITGTTPLEYIETEDTEISGETDNDEDSFHKDLAAADLSSEDNFTLSWKSAGKLESSTHRQLTNQGFYILFEDNGKSYPKISNLSDVTSQVNQRQTGKYSQTARGYIQEGSVMPDNTETDSGTFLGHYCSPGLENKSNESSPTAYTRCRNHYQRARELYTWSDYFLAYHTLGKAMHYLEDVNSPPHAALITGASHKGYEEWVRDNMRSDYFVTSASSSTYNFMRKPFSDIFRNFAQLSNNVAHVCVTNHSVSATRDCLTRTERAIAGMAYRFLIDTGRNN